MIQTLTQRIDSGTRRETVGLLETDNTAQGGRNSNRSACITAQGCHGQGGRGGATGAGRRAA